MKEEFVNANTLGVEVASTGFCGGDAGHGGRTEITFSDLSSTAMSAGVNGQHTYDVESITLEFRGDAELITFYQSLDFIKSALEYYEPKLKEY